MSILIGRKLKQRKSDVTRDRIKKAAADIFEQSGYGAVTVKKIIEKADLARGTFYIYFNNINDLLLEICKEDLENAINKMSEVDFNDDRYLDIFNVIYVNVKDTVETWEFYQSFIAYSLDNERLNDYIHQKRIEFGTITANRLLKHQTDLANFNLVRDDDELVTLAISLNCMVSGYMMDAFRSLRAKERPQPHELLRLAQFLSDVFYRAVYLSPPPKSK